MLFELSTALRFLKPTRREWARSLIALLSFTVITVICWLVLIFYSVTEGLEQRWIDQLVQFTGSVRLCPRSSYSSSYEFLIDSYSSSSDYHYKTLGWHLEHPEDPWDSESDPPLPPPLASQRRHDGKRPLALLRSLLANEQPVEALSCPVTATIHLDDLEPTEPWQLPSKGSWRVQQSLHLIGFNPQAPHLLTQPLQSDDLQALWYSLDQLQPGPLAEQASSHLFKTDQGQAQWRTRLAPLLSSVELTPRFELTLDEGSVTLYGQADLGDPLLRELASELWQLGYSKLLVTDQWPVDRFESPQWSETGWRVSLQSQGAELQVPPSYLCPQLPSQLPPPLFEDSQRHWIGVLAPKVLKDAGLHAGARVQLVRSDLIGPLGTFERDYSGWVVGFYDTGIFPLGARYLLAPFTTAQNLHQAVDPPSHNTLQLWPEQPAAFAKRLRQQLHEQKLDHLISVESYEEFPFSRDLILQLRSDRMLLSLVAVIILFVACSSIASMLVLLVNERRKDIAILKALGLAPWRVSLCFGLSGCLIGVISALCAALLAKFTLLHIDTLIAVLSHLQGQPLLNPQFYGQELPGQMSLYALKLATFGTTLLCTLAGCLASIHAARQSPANLLRSL